MAVTVNDLGHGNSVTIDPAVLESGSGTVTLTGDHNEVTIGAGCFLSNARINLGSDCTVTVAAGCRLAQIDLFAARAGQVRIGSGTNFTSDARIYLHEPGMIQFGEGCMIASETLFTVSDMHPLIDIVSGVRLNPPRDIIIGDRVWIGAEVAVMKGVTIGEGSAVGYRAVVTRDLPATCLAVGAPARVVREGVTWLASL